MVFARYALWVWVRFDECHALNSRPVPDGTLTSRLHTSPSDQFMAGAASTFQSPMLGWPPTILCVSPKATWVHRGPPLHVILCPSSSALHSWLSCIGRVPHCRVQHSLLKGQRPHPSLCREAHGGITRHALQRTNAVSMPVGHSEKAQGSTRGASCNLVACHSGRPGGPAAAHPFFG